MLLYSIVVVGDEPDARPHDHRGHRSTSSSPSVLGASRSSLGRGSSAATRRRRARSASSATRTSTSLRSSSPLPSTPSSAPPESRHREAAAALLRRDRRRGVVLIVAGITVVVVIATGDDSTPVPTPAEAHRSTWWSPARSRSDTLRPISRWPTSRATAPSKLSRLPRQARRRELLGLVVPPVPQGVPAAGRRVARSTATTASQIVGVIVPRHRLGSRGPSRRTKTHSGRSPATSDDAVAKAYGVRAVPQTFFIDADGTSPSPSLRHHVGQGPRRDPEDDPPQAINAAVAARAVLERSESSRSRVQRGPRATERGDERGVSGTAASLLPAEEAGGEERGADGPHGEDDDAPARERRRPA